MILTGFGAQAEVCTGERCSQFRDQFFSGIGIIAKPLPQLPITCAPTNKALRIVARNAIRMTVARRFMLEPSGRHRRADPGSFAQCHDLPCKVFYRIQI